MKIKTSELTGTALDWAVAKCENTEPPKEGCTVPEYSSDWLFAGPIIEREGIELALIGNCWEAGIAFAGKEFQLGPTPLIAAMRGYVASKLGDEVEVPEEGLV